TFDAAGNLVAATDPSNLPLGQPLANSGVADTYSSDFMVTLGLWPSDDPAANMTGTDQQQAGTLMHEWGHNLGLFHGGPTRTPNCKPNYQSVMNYLYQTRLLTGANLNPNFPGSREYVDFSDGSLLSIDEGLLSEDPKSLSLVNLKYKIRFYTTPLLDPKT